MSNGDIQVAPGIVANAMMCSGTPCVSGKRIGTRDIAGRFGSGESARDLALDYRITVGEIEAAIRYEYLRRLKRKPEFRAMREYA